MRFGGGNRPPQIPRPCHRIIFKTFLGIPGGHGQHGGAIHFRLWADFYRFWYYALGTHYALLCLPVALVFGSRPILSSNAGRPAPGPMVQIPVYAGWMYWVAAGNRTGRQDTSISDVRFGPLELRIRPMGFPAMPFPNLGSKVVSGCQNYQFLMI